MPKPLEVLTEPVKWRIEADDLELLRVLFPGTVNTFARALIHAWCARERAKLQGSVQALSLPQTRPDGTLR